MLKNGTLEYVEIMSDDKLKEISDDSIEGKLKEYFTRGLMTGWDACIYEISKQIAPLTSAKAIKDLIKAKVGEADGRMEKMKAMSTPVDNEDEDEADNG